MPKAKDKPTLKNHVWVIFDPASGLFYKKAPNSRYPIWKRVPYVYTSEKHLMRSLESLRKTNPEAQVVPYALTTETIAKVEHYGL